MIFTVLSIATLSSSVLSMPSQPFATEISLTGGDGKGICFNGILGKYCTPYPTLEKDQVCFKGKAGNYVCTPIKYDSKQNNFCVTGPLGGYACSAPGTGMDPTKIPSWKIGVAITGGNGDGICFAVNSDKKGIQKGFRICTPYPTISNNRLCLAFQAGGQWCTAIRLGDKQNWCLDGPLGGYLCTAPNTVKTPSQYTPSQYTANAVKSPSQ